MPPAADRGDAPAHAPVMLDEVLALLAPRSGGLYVDATVGAGGHAAAVLEASAPDGRLLGIDRDEAALTLAAARLQPYGSRARLLHGNFADLEHLLGDEQADGVLFDVGVSSMQLDDPERGFSYRADAPLDMRMDRQSQTTAYHLVNGLPRRDLERLIQRFGEERWAARIAEFIVAERERRPLVTTDDLARVVLAAVPAGARRGRTHPARRTFQALRIAVNGELDALATGLRAAAARLRPGGRVLALAFHSLEDRIVKDTFRSLAASEPEAGDGGAAPSAGATPTRAAWTVLTRHPLRPQPAEVAANPRARSAKLRALIRRPAAAGEGGA